MIFVPLKMPVFPGGQVQSNASFMTGTLPTNDGSVPPLSITVPLRTEDPNFFQHAGRISFFVCLECD
jgi:hypothetical protein